MRTRMQKILKSLLHFCCFLHLVFFHFNAVASLKGVGLLNRTSWCRVRTTPSAAPRHLICPGGNATALQAVRSSYSLSLSLFSRVLLSAPARSSACLRGPTLFGAATQPPGLGSRETVPPLPPSLSREGGRREGGREGGSSSDSRGGLGLQVGRFAHWIQCL